MPRPRAGILMRCAMPGTMWTCLGPTREKAKAVANRVIPEMLKVPWVVPDNACYGMGTPEDCVETAEQFADLVCHIFSLRHVVNLKRPPFRSSSSDAR